MTSMYQSFRRWMRDLYLSDPVTHQQAMLLQILLIGMLFTVVLAILLNIVVFGSAALTISGLTPNLLLLLCIVSALVALRRGQFGVSVGIVVVALLIGQAYALLTGGVQHNPGQLLVFMIPLVLAGLLLGRYALIVIAGLSILITIVAIELEQLGDRVGQLPNPPIGATLVLFVLVVGVLGLFLDRFGSALRSALASATSLADDNARLYRVAQEQQARLQATLASIGDAVITTDTAGHITFLNSVAERLTGWAHADAVGKPLTDVFVIVNEDTHAPIASPLDAVLREGVVIGLANHTLLLARDRREIPIDDSGAPIRDDQGTIIGVVLTFRDITERRQAEMALRQSQEQLDAILSGVADGVTVQDPTGHLLYANDTAARLIGVPSVEALIQMPVAEVMHQFELLDEHGAALPVDQLPGRLALQGQVPPAAVVRFRSKADGIERWALVRATPMFDARGAVRFAINTFHDITNIKQAEAALDAERERLRVTLASIGDAVIATDRQGQVTFMNSVAESLTGWPQSEAIEQHLDNVFTIANEQTREPVESPVAHVLHEGAVVGLANHTVLLARDGRQIPIDDSGAPIRDAAGQLIGVVLVFHDISERRRAEDALRERELLFRTMADSAPVLLWVSDTDMLRTFFNQPWLDFTGRTIEQEVGYGWAEGVHPDDYQRCLEIYISSFHQRHPFSIDYRLRRADGEYRWVFDNGAPRWTPNGIFAGYIGSCIDITERKEAEERKRALVEVSAQLNDSLDYDTTLHQMVEFFVPQFADYCLLHIVEEAGQYQQVAAAHVDPSKQALLDKFGRRDQSGSDAVSGLIMQVLQTGRPVLRLRMSRVEVESTDTNADALRIYHALDPVSLLIVPLVARGQVHGALTLATSESGRQYDRRDLSFVEDLAARCALALDNAGLYREAQRAIVVRDQFLAIASHELKTPLTALLGYTRLLQRRNERERLLSERDTRALTTIATQSARLEGLVNLLLDLSRIETGHLELETAPLDLVGLVRRLVEDIRPSLDQHMVTLIEPGAPLVVEGDELRLEQVIQNLLQNAIKYSPNGGTVMVRVERKGDVASIAVTDEGIGIPASAIPNLFRRFYRAPNVNPLHISGTGIGLYVVREIVTHHGGTIEVTSTEGVGSTFRVTLPLKVGESSDGATP